jgi:hypothetical protein
MEDALDLADGVMQASSFCQLPQVAKLLLRGFRSS